MLYYSCAHNLREKAAAPFLLHQLCAEAASSGQGEDMEFTPACGVPRWLWNGAPLFTAPQGDTARQVTSLYPSSKELNVRFPSLGHSLQLLRWAI